MRDWRGFSGFSCTCTPLGCRRVCVCISSCNFRSSVLWLRHGSLEFTRLRFTLALYRYRCRFIHAPLFSSDFILVVLLKAKRKETENLRSEIVFRPRETTTKIELCAATKRSTFYMIFNTLWLPHVWAISFFPQEKISRAGYALAVLTLNINFLK